MLPIISGWNRRFSRRRSALRHAGALAFLGAFTCTLYGYQLGDRALWSSHEGRAAQHAQRMIDSGQWGMPVLYFGESDYQKPPLYYWMVAEVARLRGGVVDGWSVRLPSTVSAVVGVWLVYVAGTAFGGGAVGFVAALIVACNLRYTWLARVGRIDMPLTVAVAVALLAFLAGYRCLTNSVVPNRRSWGWMLLAYVAVSVAVMLKGPIGLVLPTIPVILFLAWEKQPVWPWRAGFSRLMHGLGVWWGIPLTLAFAAPWFIWASVTTHGAFFRTFFLHHHWDRTLGVQGLKPEPIWYYVPQLFLDAFPWSVLIPAALWWEWRRMNDQRGALGRLAACWIIGMFGVLSLVRFKRHDYLLPLVPGLGLLLGGHWDRVTRQARSIRDARWASLVAGVLAISASGIGILLVTARAGLMERIVRSPEWGKWLHDTDRMLMGELVTAIANVSRDLPWMGAFAALATGGAAVLLVVRRPLLASGTVAAAWLALFLAYVRCVLPALEPLREQRSIAAAAREFPTKQPTLYYYGREDQQLMFYLGPGTKWLLNRSELLPVISRPEAVFVVMELDRFEMRQNDWPNVTMVPVARNTENSFGTHRNPAVLVTNAAGWELVQAQRRGSGYRHAN
jgi:4-amino-4-deoxy-L-arabinose transferase-like glycosyltransferase